MEALWLSNNQPIIHCLPTFQVAAGVLVRMENKLSLQGGGEKDSLIICRNSQGLEVRATPLRMTRHLVVFEVYNPYSILQLSEVLNEFQIIVNERLIYSGRAV